MGNKESYHSATMSELLLSVVSPHAKGMGREHPQVEESRAKRGNLEVTNLGVRSPFSFFKSHMVQIAG